MFQRLRGAIDARIAEEQARQQSGQAGLSRSTSSSARRGNASPSRRPSRLRREGSSNSLPVRGPDPAEFDAAFVIDDDDDRSTRTGTPVQESEQGDDGASTAVEDAKPADTDGEDRSSNSGHARGKSSVTSTPASDAGQRELPTDIRVKLRRLDKLESKYQELLKAYRVAHSRVVSIEPFESALRENTPLTSISDPAALTEYLNQVTTKGDMVVDELKKVTSEREGFKKKLDEAEKSTKEAWDEVANLKKERHSSDGDNVPKTETNEEADEKKPSGSTADEASPKSPATSIPGLSVFSPEAKTVTSPPPVEENEEFFSFDNEIPRLESELKEREQEVDSLKSQVKGLTGDLAVARESTESMAQSLESATREVIGLRERNDRYESDLSTEKSSLQERITSLESKLGSAESELEKSNSEVERLKSELAEKSDELNKAENERGEQSPPREEENGRKGTDEKRLTILQGIVDSLKAQLKEAETTVASLKTEMSTREAEAKDLQKIVDFVDGGLKDNEKWKTAKELVSDGKTASFDEIRKSLAPSDPEGVRPAAAASGATTGGKKKNKKKKKAGKATTEEAPETGTPPTEPIASESVGELELKIEKLTSDLSEKEAAIERLHTKLKGEESLQEEIESLRDDLLHIGEEHVESKDKVKELLAEKTALEKTIEGLEKELLEMKSNSSASNADAEKAHEALTREFEDLKIKATSLETDLTAAQQLASSRFKDLTDLREALQKIQPELRDLRVESAELKTTKEELKSKTTELTRLERRHDDLRAEMKSVRTSLADRESEVKTLNQKVGQETNSRYKAEQALEVAHSDLHYSEGKKQDIIETNEKNLRDLSKTQEELRSSRTRLLEVEEQVGQLNRDIEGLREEIELKTAQHASAQSLMTSMRDQTSEMAMQVKESQERCESLEEEVGEAHRLLSERTREGETMRRLLSDVETRADVKVREIRERLEAAVEERDRAEDEASTVGRRQARETEELKVKARDAERALRRAEEDKEELEHAQRDWKRRREDLEAESERSKQELAEVRQAVAELRDALDTSERQARDHEKEKAELRRSMEETNQRLDKLRRANKSLSEDVKSLQPSSARRPRGVDSASRSERSSIDSRVTSPPPGGAHLRNGSRAGSETPAAASGVVIDNVYLKNVFLQFLEQKDKNYQKQLIPVLGKLLHFDATDEQKWISAISSKH